MPWPYDPHLSKVELSVRDLGIAAVKGVFKDVEANLNLDGDNPARWSTVMPVASVSLDSGIAIDVIAANVDE